MIFKKSTTLSGTLMYPLMVGGCAVIYHNGHYIRTSRIVAIHDYTADQVRFETLNTKYTLLLNPTPQETVGSCLMSMAA